MCYLQNAFSSVGQSEVNNPFLYVVVPEHLRHSKIHHQLMENSKEMITHHDIHSTLKDILYVSSQTVKKISVIL